MLIPEGEPPREWAERLYDIRRWTVMPSGGHFASAEEPELLAHNITALFAHCSDNEPRTLRTSFLERYRELAARFATASISADISELTEAGLVTGRDIPGDVVRVRNGCAQTADGAIAVAGPRRTAASSAASRPCLPRVRMTSAAGARGGRA
jgi:hypothetical protein